MGITATLRSRRSAAQWHALAAVERDIRATDRYGRRKYLREFAAAFPSYHSVLSPVQLRQALDSADVVLVGDYHALAACQRYCARLIAERAGHSSRPVILGLECVYSHDQRILDEWQSGKIDENELRERIRYDLDWQYDWIPFYELLQSAKAYGARVYGLDCMPRSDLRKIAARDRHAAKKIAEIRGDSPEAQIIVFFGESHLAPSHLTAELKTLLPNDQILTVLQNIDALYWKAAGEPQEHVEAVRISDEAICVFNATPLEKYESYRLYLTRWRCERNNTFDLSAVFYNQIEALLRFLNIDKYCAKRGRAIVDLLPEVYSRCSPEAFRKILLRKGASAREAECVLKEVRSHGSCYLPRLNAIFVSWLDMRHVAEEVAHFVQLACRSRLRFNSVQSPDSERDRFYFRVLQETLIYFGSRVLYPARSPVRPTGYYALYSHPRELIEYHGLYTHHEYLEMLDFLMLHKDYETRRSRYRHQPQLIENAVKFSGSRFDFVTRELGLMLGTDLYDEYVSGAMTTRSIRALFFRDLSSASAAHDLYFELASRVGKPERLAAA
jgi:hypothetical protein